MARPESQFEPSSRCAEPDAMRRDDEVDGDGQLLGGLELAPQMGRRVPDERRHLQQAARERSAQHLRGAQPPVVLGEPGAELLRLARRGLVCARPPVRTPRRCGGAIFLQLSS